MLKQYRGGDDNMGKIKYTVIRANEPSPEAKDRFLRICCDMIIKYILEKKAEKQKLLNVLHHRLLYLSQDAKDI